MCSLHTAISVLTGLWCLAVWLLLVCLGKANRIPSIRVDANCPLKEEQSKDEKKCSFGSKVKLIITNGTKLVEPKNG